MNSQYINRMSEKRLMELTKELQLILIDKVTHFIYEKLEDTEKMDDVMSLVLSAHISSLSSTVLFITKEYDKEDKEKVKSFLYGLSEYIKSSPIINSVNTQEPEYDHFI